MSNSWSLCLKENGDGLQDLNSVWSFRLSRILYNVAAYIAYVPNDIYLTVWSTVVGLLESFFRRYLAESSQTPVSAELVSTIAVINSVLKVQNFSSFKVSLFAFPWSSLWHSACIISGECQFGGFLCQMVRPIAAEHTSTTDRLVEHLHWMHEGLHAGQPIHYSDSSWNKLLIDFRNATNSVWPERASMNWYRQSNLSQLYLKTTTWLWCNWFCRTLAKLSTRKSKISYTFAIFLFKNSFL